MVRPATDQPVCGATALSGRDILSWKRGPVSVQPPGACGDGEKDAGAITPRARRLVPGGVDRKSVV